MSMIKFLIFVYQFLVKFFLLLNKFQDLLNLIKDFNVLQENIHSIRAYYKYHFLLRNYYYLEHEL